MEDRRETVPRRRELEGYWVDNSIDAALFEGMGYTIY